MKLIKLIPPTLKYFLISIISFFLGIKLIPLIIDVQGNTNIDICQNTAPIRDYCFDSLFLGNNLIKEILSIIILSCLFLIPFIVILVGKLLKDSDTILGEVNKDFFDHSVFEKNQFNFIRTKILNDIETEINLRLSQSLHELVKIDLRMGDCLNLVDINKRKVVQKPSELVSTSSLWNRVLQFFKKGSKKELLDSKQKLINILYRKDVEGKLLILGEPGSGKTTELLQLAFDLVNKAKKNLDLPIPIIFELSAWKNDSQTIYDWLLDYLIEKYGLDQEISKRLLSENKIILLFDGLDELGPLGQLKCINSINYWISHSNYSDLVICCRAEEYEQGQEKLTQLNHAVYLEPLTNDQIKQYLYEIDATKIWQDIKKNYELLTIASKPLFLTMLVVSTQKNGITDINTLFNAYIKVQIEKKLSQIKLPSEKNRIKKTINYLSCLAHNLEEEGNTEFLIERINPSWLSNSNLLNIYKYIISFISSIIIGWSGIQFLQWTTKDYFSGTHEFIFSVILGCISIILIQKFYKRSDNYFFVEEYIDIFLLSFRLIISQSLSYIVTHIISGPLFVIFVLISDKYDGSKYLILNKEFSVHISNNFEIWAMVFSPIAMILGLLFLADMYIRDSSEKKLSTSEKYIASIMFIFNLLVIAIPLRLIYVFANILSNFRHPIYLKTSLCYLYLCVFFLINLFTFSYLYKKSRNINLELANSEYKKTSFILSKMKLFISPLLLLLIGALLKSQLIVYCGFLSFFSGLMFGNKYFETTYFETLKTRKSERNSRVRCLRIGMMYLVLFANSILFTNAVVSIILNTYGQNSYGFNPHSVQLSLIGFLYFENIFKGPNYKVQLTNKTKQKKQGRFITITNSFVFILYTSLFYKYGAFLLFVISQFNLYSYFFTPLKYLVVRFLLYCSNTTPWNYESFLEDGKELGFVQQVGRRYRFTHDLLRRHFANISDYNSI